MGFISKALYKVIKGAVKLVYPRITVEGMENLPEGACIIVGNHAQMNAPIACELYFPGTHYTWCAQEMMHLKEVPPYAYKDFWSGKPKSVRWIFKIASYLIAPLAVCVFNNANCIGVYRDGRVMNTFRDTLDRLASGARVIIFPEKNEPYNGIVYKFQDGFVNAGRMYYSRTKQALAFVPMYVAPSLKKLVLGTPVMYDPASDLAQERKRISRCLADAITNIARSLPEHTVVPYPNIPKDRYPSNKQEETGNHEETGC